MKRWMPLLISVVFLVGIFLLQSFPASESEVAQNLISVSLWKPRTEAFETFLDDNGKTLFLLPEVLKSFLPDSLIYSEKLHRIPGLLLALGALFLFFILSKKRKLPILLFAITPLFVSAAIFDFTAMLGLLLLLVILTTNNQILKLLGLIGLAHTSLVGLIAAVIYSLSHIRQKPHILALAVILTSLALRSPISQLKQLTIFSLDDYTLARTSFEVDQRVREETKTNNYQDIVPLQLKRISYNKYYFWLHKMGGQLVKLLNFEYLSTPAQLNTTVSKGLWSEKRFPLIFFWQLGLVIVGLVNWPKIDAAMRKNMLIVSVSGLLATGLSRTSDLESQSLMLTVPLTLLMVKGMDSLVHVKVLKAALGIIAIVGLVASYHHFLFKESYWRNNRPTVFTHIARMAHQIDRNQPVLATTVIGPANFYYAWISQTSPQHFNNREFRHFDLTQEEYQPGHIYIGFPGEFLGNRLKDNKNDFSQSELPSQLRLLNSFSIKDAVSYGNGNFIWTVEAL